MSSPDRPQLRGGSARPARLATRPLTLVLGLAMLLAVLAGLMVAISPAPAEPVDRADRADRAAGRGPTVVVAAGDISSCAPPGCAAARTARRVRAIDPALVLTLGDHQYSRGAPFEFAAEYDKTWGTFRGRTRPAVGNHEYLTSNARGYYRYFGKRAHRRHSGYYSFGARSWHLIALNSNDGKCTFVACGMGSKQIQWLRRDLRANRDRCEVAYFHHPPYASTNFGGNRHVRDMWQVLAGHDVEIVLNGHDHNYERYAPRGPAGGPKRNGVRQFIVGTGGVDLNRLTPPYRTMTQRVIDQHHGVLRLALRASSYKWAFVTASGRVLDRGGPISCR